MGLVGGLTTDLNAEMNDFAPGLYLTWGMFDPVSSIDDWFHSDVILIWFSNPVYTRIPHYHYIAEARYRGAEIVTVAPDVSPSAMLADQHLPVRPGSDAALALGMCRVVLDEGLVDEQFVREQTDLPLLVFVDDPARYLRQSDFEEGGSDEQFYAWDVKSGRAVPAPRGTLFWGDVEPALEGEFTVEGRDGPIAVTTVLAKMRARLDEYSPERAAELCGLHAETIRALARKIAAGRTNIIGSLGNAGKHYHGDLIERSQVLLLALTGNWGRHGSGVRGWLGALLGGAGGAEATTRLLDSREQALRAAMEQDPTLTPSIFAVEMSRQMGGMGGSVPPVFWWYRHAGYRDAWQRAEWHDPSMARPFDEYFQEAVDSGWWAGSDRPAEDQPTRVLIECGGNVLRRTRGGTKMLLEHLWPGLTMAVTFDIRMSTTALYSDIVLPIANQYEKIGFGIPSVHTMNLTFSDRAIDPPGEAVAEAEGFRRLSEKVIERARARGFAPYSDASGRERDLATAQLSDLQTGLFATGDEAADTTLRDSALVGTLPPEASLEEIRRRGYFRWTGLGFTPRALAQCTDPQPDETFVPFRRHVEQGEPYPTLTRRSQFLIEHEWFVEADEHLPRHKEPPKSGGDHPFQMGSGHNRWSIHSLNIANRLMLETHRGAPHMVINDRDAADLGVADNEEVRVYNDQGEFRVPVKTSPTARPGQVIMYNGWEVYQHPGWQGVNDAEPGMIKWLHLAGGYGHLRYSMNQWQPCPVMRNTRVAIEKVT
jgi:DMSO reductase family type II enzyme molybdopterin subunit